MHREDWTDSDESALVGAAQAGSIDAFDALARRYRPAALIVARRTLGRREGAEDVVQDSLISAYKALPLLRNPERFAMWLTAIVRNRAIKSLTEANGHEEPLSAHVDRLILNAAPSISRAETALDKDASELLACLPAEIREVADLYYLHEWSVAHIASLFGLSITTVKWRLHTARKQLRRRHSHLISNS